MRLPSVKPRQVVKALEKAGFVRKRQTGSHLMMVHSVEKKIIPVPMHAREIKRGLLSGIIKQSGLSKREFIDLL